LILAVDLRHLRYFVAIAEEGGFTRASERLWVAQSGLSAQIRRLEAEMKLTLFVRHSRGVELTDAGEVFLHRARIALRAAEEAAATGNDLDSGRIGSLRLGLSTWGKSSDARRLLDRFTAQLPHVELTVLEGYGGTLVRDVLGERLDAAIVPAPFASPELARRLIGSEPLVVAVDRAHRLATPGGPVEALDLAGEEIVVTNHPDGAGYDRAVMGVLDGLEVPYMVRPGGAGPTPLTAVEAGHAMALTTSASAERANIVLRELVPRQNLVFDIVYREGNVSAPLALLLDATQNGTPSPSC
jgi:DNA-binding transcriptional LysR family regulator